MYSDFTKAFRTRLISFTSSNYVLKQRQIKYSVSFIIQCCYLVLNGINMIIVSVFLVRPKHQDQSRLASLPSETLTYLAQLHINPQ